MMVVWLLDQLVGKGIEEYGYEALEVNSKILNRSGGYWIKCGG